MMVAGGLTAFVLVWGIELIGHLIFPLPEDLDLRNPEVADQALGSIPLPAKLIVVFAWFTGALGGGYVASRIRGRWWSPWLIASLVALADRHDHDDSASGLDADRRRRRAATGRTRGDPSRGQPAQGEDACGRIAASPNSGPSTCGSIRSRARAPSIMLGQRWSCCWRSPRC